MLPKTKRMDKSEFSFAFNQGLSVHSKNIILKVLKSKDLKNSKFAVSFLKKTNKSAVERNNFKRKVFRVLEEEIKENLVKQGFFVIFLLKKTAFGLKYNELKSEIKFSLNDIFNLKSLIK